MPLFIFCPIGTLVKQSISYNELISLSHDLKLPAWPDRADCAVFSCRFKTDFPPLSNSREQEEGNESRDRGSPTYLNTMLLPHNNGDHSGARLQPAQLKKTHGHGDPRKWPFDRIDGVLIY